MGSIVTVYVTALLYTTGVSVTGAHGAVGEEDFFWDCVWMDDNVLPDGGGLPVDVSLAVHLGAHAVRQEGISVHHGGYKG